MICFRLYYDKDKEEMWLNEMAARGYAMRWFFLGFYYFEHTKPGEYIYRVDLLNNWAANKKDYADFMEETGVEVVCQWFLWVILRRKAEGQPFEMYTDVESQMEQYSRIRKMMIVGLAVEVTCLLMEIWVYMETKGTLALMVMVLAGLFAIIFAGAVRSYSIKIGELKRM